MQPVENMKVNKELKLVDSGENTITHDKFVKQPDFRKAESFNRFAKKGLKPRNKKWNMGIFDFLTQEIAIDLGTANTLIIHNDKVVVDEPSIVAIDRNTNRVLLLVNKL